MQRMKPFRKRNPLPIGAASLAILLLLTAASLNIRDLPLIGQGPTYSARFSESAGVQPDDDVRIAGIRIGTVTDLELDGKDVVISFKAPDAWVGDRTSASIEIKTVLGQKYINLEPAGEAPLDPDASIPRERTRAPFDVIQAFSQLSTTVEDLDTDQLAPEPRGPVRDARRRRRSGARCARRSEPALADDLLARPGAGPAARQHPDDHPGARRPRRRGRTADQRRQPAARRAAGAQGGDRQPPERHDRARPQQLRGLVADNEATLRPTLEQLDGVLSTLEENSANLENGVRLLAPFVRVFGNVVGNGRWFDAYICNLDPPGDPDCDPGSSLDPAACSVPPQTRRCCTQILQNALAQLGAAGGARTPTRCPDVLAGLSPAQLTQLQDRS